MSYNSLLAPFISAIYMSAEYCSSRTSEEFKYYKQALEKALKGKTWQFYEDNRQVTVEDGPEEDLTLEYSVPCSNSNCFVVTSVIKTLYHRGEYPGDKRYDGFRGSRSENISGVCHESDPEVIKAKLLERAKNLESPYRLQREVAKQAIRRLKDEFGIDVEA